jgi:flagellar biosynthesis protein FlhA
VEEKIRSSLQQTEHGSFLALDPASAQLIVEAARNAVKTAAEAGRQAVILTNPAVRRHLRKLIERFIPDVTVLSHSEIPGNVELESIASIK